VAPSSHTPLFARIPSWIASHWRATVIVGCAVGLVATCKWGLETENIRAQRAAKKREKEVRTLVGRISRYAHNLRRRFPTGEAVVKKIATPTDRPSSTITYSYFSESW